MKRILLALIAVVLVSNVFGQRFCGSQLDFEEMKKTDSKRYQQFMDLEDQLQSQPQNTKSIPSGTITIPVVVHIVYNSNSPVENISDSQVYAQIQALNEDYRRLNADRINTPNAFSGIAGDANFEFKLARIDPNGNPTTGITRTPTWVVGFSQLYENVKSTNYGGRDAWNTQQYLNIWVCNLSGGIMGYSSFPADFATSPYLDGVAISYMYFGVGGHTSSPYDKGRTVTHEVGHWLNLYHIWGNPTVSYSCGIDDLVADTPNQFQETYGCPSFPRMDACTTTSPGIMFMNYMDYTYDACMNMFTNGQITRMRSLFDTQTGIRRAMLEFADLITTPPPSISGPAVLCQSPEYFSVSNAPAGFTWGVSSNLSINGSNASNTLTVSFSNSGPGWVNIKDAGGTQLVRKDIWIGSPEVEIDGYEYVGASARYTAIYNPLSNAYFIWSASSSGSYSVNSYGDYADYNFYNAGTYELRLDACNSCGCGAPAFKEIYAYPYSPSPSPTAAYPNPVNDILTIEIDEQARQQTITTNFSYDIRLYDMYGSMRRQTTTKNSSVQFNVSNLPNGFYFLHIYDGVNNKPEMHQIIVKH
jgi:hypothetical protein